MSIETQIPTIEACKWKYKLKLAVPSKKLEK